ncbi:MAG TPA: serine hydrolase domain-containing protein [Pseudomonadales bacterium]
MSVLTDLPMLLKRGIRRYKVPGAALAVHRRGRLYETAAGVVNLETRVPTTADTVFQIGSITKIFTTSLIMQLADRGRLDLDAPVVDVLPDFRTADRAAARRVTVRQLLTHTSGIEGDFFVDAGRGDDNIRRLQDMGTLLPSLFPPGERLSYCNFGFAMLGRITEVLTGMTWDQAMRRRLFRPLGMTHALTLPEETLRYRAAIGHVPNPKKPGEQMLSPMPWLSLGQKAAGATPAMSAADLLKFAVMHVDRGVSKAGERILSRSAVRDMQRVQFKLPRHFAGGLDAWGLGWMLMRWSGKRVIGHDGGTVGQYAFLRIVPDDDLAIALLTNGGDARGLYDELMAVLLQSLARIELPALPAIDEALTERLAGALDRYVGRYVNIAGSTEVSAQGGRLFVESTPSEIGGMILPKTPLAFVDRNTVRMASGDPITDRNLLLFQDAGDSPARYLQFGARLSRRSA